jgi:hypothetical protein
MSSCETYAPTELHTVRSLRARTPHRLTLLEAADFLRTESQGEMIPVPYLADEALFVHDGMVGADEFIGTHLKLPRSLGLHAPFWARIIDFRNGANLLYATHPWEGVHGVLGIVLYPDGDAPGEGHKYWRALQAQPDTDTAERYYLYCSMRWRRSHYRLDQRNYGAPRLLNGGLRSEWPTFTSERRY